MTNLRQRFRDYGQQLRQAQFHIFAQVHAERAAAAVGKDLKIAACLRRFHHSERVFLAGNLEIVRVVARDLQEYAAVGAAFICLSSGMQKARTEAEARRNLFSIADGQPNFLQTRFVGGIHLNVRQ